MVRWVCLGVRINGFASDRAPMRALIDQLGDLGSATSYGALAAGTDILSRDSDRPRRSRSARRNL